MTDQTPPPDPPMVPLETVEEPPPPGFDYRWVIGALAALVVALGIVLAVVLLSDDDTEDDPVATTTTSTSAAPTTTAAGATTTTTAAVTTTTGGANTPTDAELATVVWPGPDSGLSYTTPEAAVQGAAEQLFGFADPVIGEYQAGDSRSGEFEIRPDDPGPITTVFVRQLSDGGWWVLGAATESIALDTPSVGATIASPAALEGRSRAFEAVVNVSVFELGDPTLLGKGIVMGSGDADLGPFSGEVTFEEPDGDRGVVVLYTLSAKDGSVMEATATPVRFG